QARSHCCPSRIPATPAASMEVAPASRPPAPPPASGTPPAPPPPAAPPVPVPPVPLVPAPPAPPAPTPPAPLASAAGASRPAPIITALRLVHPATTSRAAHLSCALDTTPPDVKWRGPVAAACESAR